MFALLEANANAGMALTDSYAMTPAASVSGYYFSHPKSRYLSIGKISQEQVDDLSLRSGKDNADLPRLLAPNLD